MTSTRSYIDYLEDIRNAIDKIETFIRGMSFEQFLYDDKTAYAVVRALEIIGEATKNVPKEIKSRYPEIPWREMAGMRDKLSHEYFGVNMKVVWKTVTDDIPPLNRIIEAILVESSDE